jgi:16S rRNA (guanine527-N7)-methyltransferase
VRRAQRAGVRVSTDRLEQLERYLELLRLWSRRINLTSLPLEPASDEALDRLIGEPIVASKRLTADDHLLLDIGSGGGSPAIPLKICVPHLRMVLVEAKVRKTAFLREVIRQLGLKEVEVENRRVEELLARADLHESADVVSLRAVRAERGIWTAIQAFLRPGGRVFWFANAPLSSSPAPAFEFLNADALGAGIGNLNVLRKLSPVADRDSSSPAPRGTIKA